MAMGAEAVTCEHEQSDFEEDLIRAREALWVDGDLEHCRHHLAGAFAAEPNDDRCARLFAEWLAAAPDVDAVLARSQRWLGDVLVEAQICIHRGDANGAVLRTLAAIAHGGDQRLADWLRSWTRGGQLSAELDAQAVARQLLAITRSEQADAALHAAVDDWLDEIDDQLQWQQAALTLRVRFKRAAGRAEAALQLAQALDERLADPWSAAAIAACHRDAGNYEQAYHASMTAADRDPSDGFPLLDAGDMALDRMEDYAKAIAAYAEAERRGAKPEWARLSRLAAEYLQAPGAGARAAFEAEAEAQPDSPRTGELRDALDEWITYIRTPREACLNLLRQIDLADQEHLRIGLNSPEAGNAHWVLQQACAKAGAVLEIECGSASPDPRGGLPDLAAFGWQDATVAPLRAPPEQAPWKAIKALADTDFDPLSWLRKARQIKATPADTLVAMIPYPPDAPSSEADPLWWQRAWTAACTFALASTDDGWNDLVRAVRAPIDWSGEAALVALAAWVVEDHSRYAAWRKLLEECRLRYPDQGDCCLRYAIDASECYVAERSNP